MSNAFDLAALLRPQRKLSANGAPVSVLSNEVNSSLHTVALDTLTDRCEVLRFLTIDDETGGVTTVWTQAGSYPCSVESTNVPRESVQSGQGLVPVAPYRVKVPRSASILNRDRLGVPGWFNGWTPNTVYATGAKVLPPITNPTFFIEAANAGSSSLATGVDSWPATDGAQLQDGSVMWHFGGRVSFLEVVATDDASSNEEVLVVFAKAAE